jgi:energy-coupling factor transporter ATP-binding protein EcfA2
VRITSLLGTGVLSFDQFRLDLSERVTFIVGPNGAGKSNLNRLLTICLRAVETGDGVTSNADQLLASFAAARHIGAQSPGIEARVSVKFTDAAEQALITQFVKAMAAVMITGAEPDTDVVNYEVLDAWVNAEITEDMLWPLMKGEIVASHPGTEDGQWQCAYEFTAPGHDQAEHRYRWTLLGSGWGIIDVDAPGLAQEDVVDIARQIAGPPLSDESKEHFDFRQLLPRPGTVLTGTSFTLDPYPSVTERRFAQMAGLPLASVAGEPRKVTLATVLRVILRQALVQTSDTRLLPSGGMSWSAPDLAAAAGFDAQLPEFLLRLKNGDPSERARYQRVRELFMEFTQGRGCEVRLVQVQQPAPGGQGTTIARIPAIWVTVNVGRASTGPVPEVPIEFAGAGAWEALVLACALGEPSASAVVLDEPAVALHATLQRQLGAYLLSAPAQFLVITHSAELLPITDATDVEIVRLDRDDKIATRAHPLGEACRRAMSGKLAAKGNERLPFAWRAILCEGEADVQSIMTLAGRMCIDLRRLNIAVADCGGRDNLPGYIWFCAELGLQYLAVMDADTSKPDALPKAQAVRDAVKLRKGGDLAEFPEDLETTFGVPKQRPSLVPGVIQGLSFVGNMPDPAQAPPEVVGLAQAIQRLTR